MIRTKLLSILNLKPSNNFCLISLDSVLLSLDFHPSLEHSSTMLLDSLSMDFSTFLELLHMELSFLRHLPVSSLADV